ncbi:hypothetical protein JK635_08390 [Neobacillus sp. YIM B02564]|uniref:Uncharacterized protein n=1 Tax=Neobacillus paridis TaxID=2803862 RepID=A0ABS1TPR1_9BACI|nr:hypothetical protein [Neobacillus paridis]
MFVLIKRTHVRIWPIVAGAGTATFHPPLSFNLLARLAPVQDSGAMPRYKPEKTA